MAQRNRRRQQRQTRLIAMGALVAVILLVSIGVDALASKGSASGSSADNTSEMTGSASTSTSSTSDTTIDTNDASDSDEALANMTPIFASYGDVDIHVAVSLDDLTEIAFHQASYDWALALDTTLPDAELDEANGNQGTGRSEEQASGPGSVLKGSVLRLWRSGRSGDPNTAIDCGAAAGSSVLSPVDGTVVRIRSYELYGKYSDYEIHIQPTGHPELDVVVIHVTDLTVEVGDKLIGGVTQIGAVRELASKMSMQLGDYTVGDDPGNHTHIQVNDATYEGYTGLEGAIEVDENGDVVE